MLRTLATCLLAGPALLTAQTITLAEGTAASATVLALAESDPNGAATVVLQDVAFLPVEIAGRYLGQESDTTRSRRVVRNGLSRVELPDGGRVLRYRRGGGAHWGFLHVAADRTPRVVLERPGLLGANDPFEDRIGVAPDGGHLAVPELFGGLWIVRLDGGSYASTGGPARRVLAGVTLEAPSVLVGSQVVWFQSEFQQVFRCGLGDNAAPVDVSPPPQAGAILKDEMAMARDGSRVVYLYGPQQQQRLWTAGLVGGATVLPPPPGKYEDPGYLPEGAGEPALLLNADGTRLFYVDSDVRDELYVLDTTGALPSLHVTDDPIFQPYIGVHVLPFFVGDALTVAVGDPNRMDWFRARLGAAGGTVVNLSGTGALQPPFPEGTIDPVGGVRRGGELLAVEQLPGALALRRVDPSSGAQTVLHQDLVAAPAIGSGFGGAVDFVVPTQNGDRLYAAGGPAGPLFPLPPGLAIDPPATGPSFRAVWVELVTGFGITAFYLPDGTFVTGPVEFGLEQLCLTAAGGVVAIGSPVRYLAAGVYVVMNRPPVAWRRCLSGAGV